MQRQVKTDIKTEKAAILSASTTAAATHRQFFDAAADLQDPLFAVNRVGGADLRASQAKAVSVRLAVDRDARPRLLLDVHLQQHCCA